MRVYEKVFSTEMPKDIEVDLYNVYVNSNIVEASEEEKQENGISSEATLYSYTTTEYNKDEYIIETSTQLKNMSKKETIPPEQFFALTSKGVTINGQAVKQGNMIQASFEITPEEGSEKSLKDLWDICTVRSDYPSASTYTSVGVVLVGGELGYASSTTFMLSLGSSVSSQLMPPIIDDNITSIILIFNYMCRK